uniref:ethanolamine kinase n=1 Tax=Chelydra serpentina TaxID=8475 RepID=A0A8C3RQL6_CHESE
WASIAHLYHGTNSPALPYLAGATQLFPVPRPNHLPRSLPLQLFTDGITNKLMACYMDEGMADAVLVRVYGRKTELFVDRENELKNFQVLRAHGCAPNLYCTFQNGLCYEFMQGTALGPEHVRRPQIFRCVWGEGVCATFPSSVVLPWEGKGTWRIAMGLILPLVL